MTTEQIDFRVMGVQASVVVVDGAPGLSQAARARIDELERRWSRFSPDSEVSRLVPGAANLVSDDTYALVECAVAGWRLTGGRFDPTVRDAVVAAGYDRSFDQIGTPDRTVSVAIDDVDLYWVDSGSEGGSSASTTSS